MITVAATTTKVAVAIVVVVVAATVPITTEALYIFFNVRSYFTNAMSPHQKNTIQYKETEAKKEVTLSSLTNSLIHFLPLSITHFLYMDFIARYIRVFYCC